MARPRAGYKLAEADLDRKAAAEFRLGQISMWTVELDIMFQRHEPHLSALHRIELEQTLDKLKALYERAEENAASNRVQLLQKRAS